MESKARIERKLQLAIIKANRIARREKETLEQIAEEKANCTDEITKYMSELGITSYEFEEKGENYSQLNNLPKNVKYIYLFGKSQNKIYKKIKKNKNFSVYKCDTITNAINFASLKSIKGEVVLLSPACASFDSFANFEERGNYFKEIVNNLT